MKEIEVVMLPSAVPNQLDALKTHLVETQQLKVDFVALDTPPCGKPRVIILPDQLASDELTGLSEGPLTLAKELIAGYPEEHHFYYVLVGKIALQALINIGSGLVFDDIYNLSRLEETGANSNNNFAQRVSYLLEKAPLHLRKSRGELSFMLKKPQDDILL